MTEMDLQEIGKRICVRRKQLGLTQERLAEQMDVSIQMVSNLERGNKAIRIENLIRLSQILDISTDYILIGRETAGDIQGLAARMEQLPENNLKMIEVLVDYCLEHP